MRSGPRRSADGIDILKLKMKLNAVFEQQKEGGFTAYIPALPGCISEGETLPEAKQNLQDALEGYLLVANRRSLQIAKQKHAKALALSV